MTTATGDIAYDFAAAGDQDPWALADWAEETPTPFRPYNGMTAIIASNALKSDFNSAGYLLYVDALPDQSSWHTKGEHVKASGSFNDQVGCGGVNESGDGYILWINGNQWRVYRVDAFVLTQLGDTVNVAHNALDVVGLQYEFTAGEATLTATRNGDPTTLVRTDSVSPHNGDLRLCWYFNADDSNSNGFRSIAADGVATGPQVVSVNGSSPVVVGGSLAVVTAEFVPTGMTVGGIGIVDFASSDADNHTGTMPFFMDGQTYPFMGAVTAVVYDNEDPPNEPDIEVTLQLPAGWASVTYATLSTDEDSLAQRIEGATIETGDHHYYETADITLYDDSTFADAPSGTVVTWLHKAATGVVIQVNIVNGAPVTPGAGSLLLRPYATIGDYPILNPPINR